MLRNLLHLSSNPLGVACAIFAPCPRRQPGTSAAVPPRCALAVSGVCLVIRVTLGTLLLKCVECRWRCAPMPVCESHDCLKMRWVTAKSLFAQVIYFPSFWDRSFCTLVRHSVCIHSRSLITAHVAVTASPSSLPEPCLCASPEPTLFIGRYVYVSPDSRRRRCSHAWDTTPNRRRMV